MQALYALTLSDYTREEVFDINLKESLDEIRENEKKKGETGDIKLLLTLYEKSIKNSDEYDEMIQDKARNWELERIALLDRILMWMAICEMTSFEEIPVKVSINEYLEIAKEYSTPQSSKFINGILDNLRHDLREKGLIVKKGRGLIQDSVKRKNKKDT